MLTSPRRLVVLSGIAMGFALVSRGAWGQSIEMRFPAAPPASSPSPSQVKEAHAQFQRRSLPLERDLRKIRQQYFKGVRNPDIRRLGIAKLQEFNDPASFPTLLDVFRDEADVRVAMMDHLASLDTPEAHTTLAWTAVFDEQADVRTAAKDKLARRFAHEQPGLGVQSVVAEGLRRSNNTVLTSSANLAEVLKLYEAIPMMVAAQLGGGTGGGGASRQNSADGALAYILVGRQQSFVSDLEPVVGDSAVGFDPTLSVVTEGVVLRVIDAAVVTYQMDVHSALTRLSSAGWGRSTSELGFDQRRWREWVKAELPAIIAKRDQAAREAEAPATPSPTPARGG